MLKLLALLKHLKYIRLSIIEFFIILLFSCASVPSAQPTLNSPPNAYKQVFPENRYIARRGHGSTREAALMDATCLQ